MLPKDLTLVYLRWCTTSAIQCGVGILMREIVDRAFDNFIGLDDVKVAQCRERITEYISKLMSAGQKDPDTLTECARVYLKEMHEGRDPRFTGC